MKLSFDFPSFQDVLDYSREKSPADWRFDFPSFQDVLDLLGIFRKSF